MLPEVRLPYQFEIRTRHPESLWIPSDRDGRKRRVAVIAVMGAAGNVGNRVADLLLQAGEEVRVLKHARDLTDLEARGADVVQGDAMNVDDLRALFTGVSTALVLLPENVADPSFVESRASQGMRSSCCWDPRM
jgi:hypothetical protein